MMTDFHKHFLPWLPVLPSAQFYRLGMFMLEETLWPDYVCNQLAFAQHVDFFNASDSANLSSWLSTDSPKGKKEWCRMWFRGIDFGVFVEGYNRLQEDEKSRVFFLQDEIKIQAFGNIDLSCLNIVSLKESQEYPQITLACIGLSLLHTGEVKPWLLDFYLCLKWNWEFRDRRTLQPFINDDNINDQPKQVESIEIKPVLNLRTDIEAWQRIYAEGCDIALACEAKTSKGIVFNVPLGISFRYVIQKGQEYLDKVSSPLRCISIVEGSHGLLIRHKPTSDRMQQKQRIMNLKESVTCTYNVLCIFPLMRLHIRPPTEQHGENVDIPLHQTIRDIIPHQEYGPCYQLKISCEFHVTGGKFEFPLSERQMLKTGAEIRAFGLQRCKLTEDQAHTLSIGLFFKCRLKAEPAIYALACKWFTYLLFPPATDLWPKTQFIKAMKHENTLRVFLEEYLLTIPKQIPTELIPSRLFVFQLFEETFDRRYKNLTGIINILKQPCCMHPKPYLVEADDPWMALKLVSVSHILCAITGCVCSRTVFSTVPPSQHLLVPHGREEAMRLAQMMPPRWERVMFYQGNSMLPFFDNILSMEDAASCSAFSYFVDQKQAMMHVKQSVIVHGLSR